MMMIYENIRLALFSLKANKMRALLTMLGIIIGIGSVIAIMTVGDSVTSTVADSMSSLGANNITVTLEERKDDEEASDAMFGMNWGSSKDENAKQPTQKDHIRRYIILLCRLNAKQPTQKDYITTDMLRQMKEAFGDSITAYSITEQVGSGSIQQNAESGKANVSVMGTSLGYFLANDVQLVQGSYFSEEELENGAMVALLSEEALDDLFHGDADAAVGSTMTVSVNDKYYNLIIEGVYAKDEDETMSMYSMFMNSDATNLYIPLKTAQDINHASGYQTLTVVVDPNQNPDQLAADIESYFDNLYRNNRDFIVSATSMASMVSIMETMMSTITTAIALIGGIALVVGGIGVMNIMLVSITERTREIGTRKALGAPNSSIRLQFIIESIVICLIGGAIGIVVGCVGCIAAANYIGASAVPSVKSILISLGFSMAIGVFFGYYPANKAAKLNPIDALRYE